MKTQTNNLSVITNKSTRQCHVSHNNRYKILLHTSLTLAIYLLSLSIYLHPLVLSATPSEELSHKKQQTRWNLITHPKPQLDEIHILDPDNHDVSPPSACQYHHTNDTVEKGKEEEEACPSWKQAWYNDYWGRPLDSPSSHKSWRPLSVWSFRFLKGGGKGGRWIIGWIGRAFAVVMDRILSIFRLGGGGDSVASHVGENDHILASELFVHRFINVLIHASIVQLIGVVSTLLFPSSPNNNPCSSALQTSYTRHFSQLLFALHPTHVEAVANAANRPHLLGLLFNAAIVDPSFPLVGVALLSGMGLLCAETALFPLPAVLVTMTAIRYRERVVMRTQTTTRDTMGQHDEDTEPNNEEDSDEELASKSIVLGPTLVSLLPRYLLLLLTNVLYLLYRHANGTLSIPPGLIRPAENPYYNKVGTTWSLARRMMNYSYVTSLHILKSVGVEWIGFSHEYGYDCIPEMRVGVLEEEGMVGVSVVDLRLGWPIGFMVVSIGLCVWCWYGGGVGGGRDTSAAVTSRRDVRQKLEDRTMRMLLLLVFVSWMATLFPIAGFLKVGTFVADRIVVPSTFGTCIFGGRLLALWIVGDEPRERDNVDPSQYNHRATIKRVMKTIFILAICTQHFALRTHNRIAEWMDSATLLESSLRACPRSIKSNLEMSKLYSGLVPHMVDFEKALRLIETAQKIDPSYCDVHQQFGHVYFQQGKYIQFEKEMVKSLLCPFTMGQAMGNWKKYWNAVLAPRNGKTDVAARKRYDEYMKSIEESIDREGEKSGMETRERRIRDGSNLEDEL
ncbi:hypothetical protein HJC23_011779 [Cyclotella cryptica]|uniref:Uncharacterized protein n=1 Tax=Cyclotella cryptica TaxID=29204 RepID=A0ABD3PIS7_9STRA